MRRVLIWALVGLVGCAAVTLAIAPRFYGDRPARATAEPTATVRMVDALADTLTLWAGGRDIREVRLSGDALIVHYLPQNVTDTDEIWDLFDAAGIAIEQHGAGTARVELVALDGVGEPLLVMVAQVDDVQARRAREMSEGDFFERVELQR